MSYEVVDSQCVYKGKVMDIYRDKVTMPNGYVTVRETVARGNAVAIIPVDNEGNIIFVRQYRHATRSMVLEIPAGMIEKNEAPAVAAMRELEEETGYKCAQPVFISDVYMAIGICTEKVYFYIAENLTEGVMNPDPDEFIEIEKYSVDKAVEMVFKSEIHDVKTMAGILAYKEYKENLKK